MEREPLRQHLYCKRGPQGVCQGGRVGIVFLPSARS
jgi:hypothetical protein